MIDGARLEEPHSGPQGGIERPGRGRSQETEGDQALLNEANLRARRTHGQNGAGKRTSE